MNKKTIVTAVFLVCFSVAGVFAQAADTTNTAAAAAAPAVKAAPVDLGQAAKYIAAGLAVGLACIGGGIAVGKIGASAMGAMSENAELSGKAMPFVGLAEGICLWGFLVALLVLVL
ncbi:MAG: ATP synthase subunit C [Treponema sp.]|jgi:V/A-type H+-transporting ATPase subunit K|nr:ATP synthase subunit C [Treponema sp.]